MVVLVAVQIKANDAAVGLLGLNQSRIGGHGLCGAKEERGKSGENDAFHNNMGEFSILEIR